MKRSEAVKYLDGFLISWEWDDPEALLKCIEKLGMLPPVPKGMGHGVVLEDLKWEPELESD